MTDSKFAAYIEAITFLERRLGTRTSYRTLEPFSFDATDIVAVNKAARRIAEFIGLGEYMFVVAVKSQEEGVGGNIDLHYGEPGAFVEVAQDAVKFEDAVLATLAHEITHKFLHIRDIPITPELNSQLDEEILTDITAVFLGLGKLMLRGCECKKVSTQEGVQGKVTTTETYRCGYLDRSQLSLVYLLVSAMRRIPAHVCEAGLHQDAVAALSECRRAHSPFLDTRWYERVEKSGGTIVPESLTKGVSVLQHPLAEMSRDLLFLQHCLGSIDSFLEQVHKRLYQSRRCLAGTPGNIEPDPCLRYLDTLQRAHEAALFEEELNAYLSKAKSYREALRKTAAVIETLVPSYNVPSLEFYRFVACKLCGKRLRLPENSSGLTAECPECHYRFKAITLKPEFAPSNRIRKMLVKLLSYWI
jgi:hypothetical protein